MEAHEVCSLFPMMGDEDYNDLAQDIARNGLIEPIRTYQGKVIDGRNRLRACRAYGIEPRTQEWDGHGSLVQLVMSLNLHRRHLDEGQRSMVAARAKPLFEEEAAARQRATQFKKSDVMVSARVREPSTGKASAKAAKLAKVSPRSVEHGSKVLRDGIPELAAAVDGGAVSVSAAAKVSELPKAEQSAVVAKGPEAIKAAAKQVRLGEKKTGTKPRGRPREIAPFNPSEVARKLVEKLTVDQIDALIEALSLAKRARQGAA